MNVKSLMTCLLAGSLLAISCKKESAEEVNPSDSNKLQSVLVIPNGTLVSGTPPAPTQNGPIIQAGQSSASVNSGNQVTIPFSYSSTSGYNNCYVQVDGASNGYIRITGNNSANNGTISIPVNVPSSVTSGTFSMAYCIDNGSGQVSNWQTITVNVTGQSSNPGNTIGNGSFTFNGQNYTGICVKNPPPSSSGGPGFDVVLTNQNGSTGIVFYNVTAATSGSTSFVDPMVSQTGLWMAVTDGSGSTVYWSKNGGTFTKTGANKFTFSATVYDSNTNAQKSISGSGTWQ